MTLLQFTKEAWDTFKPILYAILFALAWVALCWVLSFSWL